MFDYTQRFITRMKLQELRDQRVRLHSTYRELHVRVEETSNSEEKLRILYDSLRKMEFAGTPLYKDIAGLEVLLTQIDSGIAPPDLIAFWLDRLQHELEAGEARSEAVYTFGLLLEEWALQPERKDTGDSEQIAATTAIRTMLAQKPPVSDHVTFIKALVSLSGKLAVSDTSELARLEAVNNTVDLNELETVLTHLQNSVYRSPTLRNQARQIRENKALMQELADALTIILAHLDSWSWPSEGVPVQVVDARSQWRLFMDEDLPTACLLELIGFRWHLLFKRKFLGEINRYLRLLRLLELGAPDVIIKNERRMLEEAGGMRYAPITDVFANPESENNNLADVKSLPTNSLGGIFPTRIKQIFELHDVTLLDRYSGEKSTDLMQSALRLIHAEIALARATASDQPLYLIKIDLKNFFASIPHNILLTMLDEFGLSADQQRFFARYLAAPLRFDDQVVVSERGIPNDHILSNVLAELLMILLDHYVANATQVMIVRLVDDLCILTQSADKAVAAWQAVAQFCATCELAINLEKSGAVCIGGVLPAELPNKSPGWLMLSLDSDGEWQVNQALFESYLARMKSRLNGLPTLLDQVAFYNGELEFLVDELAIQSPLGAKHRERINAALLSVEQRLLGTDIASAFMTRLRVRYAESNLQDVLPGGWFFWPLTAGGLGVKQVSVYVTIYDRAFRNQNWPSVPTTRDTNWQWMNNDWSRYYSVYLDLLHSNPPPSTPVMERLIAEFIARGASLTGGKQKTLGDYWRWIVYTYGLQVLDRLGTFDFLITTLVPMQLIGQQQVGNPVESNETE